MTSERDCRAPRPAPGLTAAEVATAFMAPLELVPHLPELLADLDALGGDAELAVAWLTEAGLARGARVLDLCSGKGAIALAVAQALGVEVEGVEGFAPFVALARARAAALGLAGRCRFRVADVRTAAARSSGFDAVLLLSAGEVLGGAAATVGALRRTVRPGGLMLVDEGYRLGPGPPATPGYGRLATREETLAGLCAHGDELLRERLATPAEVRAQARGYHACITARAARLAARHPELVAALADYLEGQERECRTLEEEVQCATWLLRRPSSDTALPGGPEPSHRRARRGGTGRSAGAGGG